MARGDHKIGQDPFRTWIATVEAAHRVRLPRAVADIVSWLTADAGGVEVVATPGPAGGVLMQPLAAHREEVQRLTRALRDSPPTESEADQRWMNMARLLATAWAMTISFDEAERFNFKIPEPPRRMQLLPGAGGTVVVFGFGQILEIWDASRWYEHVRTTAARKSAAMSEALEDLGQR